MLKKLFTLCSLVALLGTGIGISSLTSCSSPESEADQQFGVMTLQDFATGRGRFLITNQHSRFFFVYSDGSGDTGVSGVGNEVVTTGVISVDRTSYNVSIIYKTDEHQQPSGIPETATLTLTLTDTSSTTSISLMEALRGTIDADLNPKLQGDPITMTFNYNSASGFISSTLEVDSLMLSDEGVYYLGRDTIKGSAECTVNVIEANVELP